ncbi:MAG TPA: type IV pilin protein [Steroidobacteraceae bacterium]|jgi:type IV pilus assembly protein PilE|nr:type IV pilin protein [Steroidobacteraceae bacterium]
MESRANSGAAGFSLIELMVVVAIATILLSIAIPSYMSQVRQSRRTDAKTALLDLAGREESYFSTSVNGANYTATPGNLGYAGAWPVVVGGGYYQVTVCVVNSGGGGACAPSAQPGPSYTVIATPVAGQSQVKDTQCTAFAVDSVGQQYAADSTGTYTAAAQQYCWAN